MPEVDLVAHLFSWSEAHAAVLERSGVHCTYGRSQDQRPKRGAWINCRHGSAEAELLLWDTGEAEYMSGRLGPRDVVNEHHDIGSIEQLEALLERLLADLDRLYTSGP